MTIRVHFDDPSLRTATVACEPSWFDRLFGATERTFTVVRDISLGGGFTWHDDSRACTVRDARIVRALDGAHRDADRAQVANAIWARKQRLDSY